MAVIASTPAPPVTPELSVTRGQQLIELVAAAAVFTVFTVFVVPRTGGRETAALVAGIASTGVAFLMTRSWRYVPRAALGLLSLLAAAAFAVCLLTPAGRAGLRFASFYSYAALTYAYVAGYARTNGRRLALGLALCAAGVVQFAEMLLPWFGGRDATRKMVGTFYWHNQFGAYMLALAIVAGALALFGRRVPQLAGLIIAPILAATVLLSASRGSILLLVASWIAIGVLAAVQSAGRLGALVRWAVLGLAALGVATALSSSLFFPPGASGSGLASVRRRGSEQPADDNVRFRLAHDRAALAVFREHPIVGVGFNGYLPAAAAHLPPTTVQSPFVHNGYLQAAVDGGVVLAGPLLVALFFALIRIGQFAVRRWRTLSAVPAHVGCAVAALALLAHSAIDMDWTYPALVALVAALLAVATTAEPPAHGASAGVSQVVSPNGR